MRQKRGGLDDADGLESDFGILRLLVGPPNAADTVIATVSSATSERIFRNANVGLAVAEGDYIEIKGVQPTWPTSNPLTTIYGGYVYIE